MDAPNQTFIEQYRRPEEEEESDTLRKPLPLYKKILGNRLYQAVLVIVLFAAVLVPLTYFFVVDNVDEPEEKNFSCLVTSTFRVPCGVENSTVSVCRYNKCCYDQETEECYHSVPSAFGYTEISGAYVPTQLVTPLDTKSIPELKISRHEEANSVQIILHDANVPVNEKRITSELYEVHEHKNKLTIEICRDTGERILTTGNGPLIASEGYWEWTFQLTDSGADLLGLGGLLLNDTEVIRKVIYKNRDDHNTVPAFMGHENGLYHGLIVEHDGPLEVLVLPSKLVVLRSILGRKIVLTLVIGPTPKDVMFQQRRYKEQSFPRWILGAHLCSQDEITESTRVNAEMEYVSDCLDENLMMRLISEEDVTKLAEIKEKINTLRKSKKFVIYLTPHVPKGNYKLYLRAVELKVLYADAQEQIYHGTYKNEEVAFLDFEASNLQTWLKEFFDHVKRVDPAIGDAIVLVDNWPAEETYDMNDTITNFPYLNEDILSAMSYSLPWDLVSSKSQRHYAMHNNYGQQHASAIEKYISKPTMTSSYVYGMHNAAVIRNINIGWSNFKEALTRTLYHSFFMHPLVSAPVCGSSFFNSSNIREEEICIRWYIMASTMPLLIAPSDFPRHSSGNLGYAGLIAHKAIVNREQLSYYYYQFLSNQEPIARPMFYDFYQDNETISLDEQYMVGDSLLVAHPVYTTNSLRIYLPPSANTWYEFWGGIAYTKLGWITMSIVESDSVVFMKAGKIVPLKIKDESKDETFMLVVAMSCKKTCFSEGVLLFGTASLELSATDKKLTIRNIKNVQNDIICADKVYPDVIKYVKVYKDGEVIVSEVNVILCDVLFDDYDIPLNLDGKI